MRILLVEDDEKLKEALCFQLQKEGIETDSCTDGEEALYYIRQGIYDLILLDRMLPLLDGASVLTQMRREGFQTPVILITALGALEDKIEGLDLGADDYISKPFRIKELLARMKSVLRRCKIDNPDGCVRIKNLEIRTGEAKVFKDGKEIILTAMEYRLLLILLNNRGHILSRTALLENIWDVAGDFVNDNTLTVYIKRLRDKIEDEPENPSIIRTVRGMGYVIEND